MSFSEKLHQFGFRSTLSLLGVVLLLAGLVLAVFVSRQQQEQRSRAAEPAIVAQGSIPSETANGVTVTGLTAGQQYKIVISGTFQNKRQPVRHADAQWLDSDTTPDCYCNHWSGPKFNGTALLSEDYQTASNPNHVYTFLWTANATSLKMHIEDTHYFDNTGSLEFVIQRVASQETSVSLDLLLHGIGKAGDNQNPDDSDGSNQDPDHKTRKVKVEIRDIADESLILAQEGDVTYDSGSDSYKGEVGLDSGLTSGETYKIWVKLSQSLWNKNTTREITIGQTHTIPQLTLENGDANGDGWRKLEDYNIIRDCYFDPDIGIPAKNCNPTKKEQADINDDGEVHHFDLSLFLREMSVQD